MLAVCPYLPRPGKDPLLGNQPISSVVTQRFSHVYGHRQTGKHSCRLNKRQEKSKLKHLVFINCSQVVSQKMYILPFTSVLYVYLTFIIYLSVA